MKIEKDVADFAVEFGLSSGASYVEARLLESSEEMFAARNARFLGILEVRKKGIGIRVRADGGMGFGSTGNLNKEAIKNIIEMGIKTAKASKRKDPIVFSEEKIEEASWKTPVKEKFIDVSREDKQQFIKDLDNRLKTEVGKNLKNRIAYLALYSDEKYIATSEGAKMSSENSLVTLVSIATAKAKTGTEQRIFYRGGSGGWEWTRESNVEDAAVSDSLGALKTAQTAKTIKFDNPIDVIISGEVAGIICHENVGHPSEGDRILGREGAQAGESFYGDLLKDDKLGEVRIGNDCVTIIDDPTLPVGAGFYLYDDECVKARPRYLIKNGMLNELLLNREYGARFNTKSNAASRATGYNREPISRMANTYFAPGDFNSVDELIEDVKEGILMNNFTEWNIDDRRFQSKYVGCEAYLIKNGELTDIMVRRPILELTTFGIFGSVDAVTKEYDAPFGLCGKGDPMQGIPVSMGGGHVRMRNITVGGGS